MRAGRDARFASKRPMPEIVFVSREVHPLASGGIGTHVHAAARALAQVADVTVITTSLNEERYRKLERERDPELPRDVRFVFVEEPRGSDDLGGFYSILHAYSARVYEKLRELYARRGPDLIEFSDYIGEGLVTLQARRTLDPMLRNTLVCVRTHITEEMARVLDGHRGGDLGIKVTFEAERYTLALADRVIWQGGDILGTYQRFYGANALASPVRIPNAVSAVDLSGKPPAPPPTDGPLKLLYVGRLERRKGVQNLIRAVTALPRDDWRLTLVGSDTPTAPRGSSMSAQLRLMAAGDPRITFSPPRPRRELAELFASHHLLVLPSLWECWPNVVLEALQAGRPAIGTRTGGLVEMLADERAGWLVPSDELALADALERILQQRERVDELIATGAPREVFDKLADEDAFRRSYLELAGEQQAAPSSRNGLPPAAPGVRRPPLVSVVIPYFRMSAHIEATVQSACEQDYPRLEVIVVNDGSLWPHDAVLADLAAEYPLRVLTRANSGLGGARNAGIRQSRGKYIFPLDADNMARSDFVSRCVEVLEEDPAVAYVTSWSSYIDEDGKPFEDGSGYRPIGNSAGLVMEENVAGDAAAVIRRRVFDLGHSYSPDLPPYEDWQLYREMYEDGLYGRVIPEPLLLYRVRRQSMLQEFDPARHEQVHDEMTAHLIERRVEWECKSG
jgi:glycosyltransferase involved in cell wall biosynthesis